MVSLGCVAPLALSLTSTGFTAFLVWFGIAYAIYVASQAGILSGVQAAVEPASRGFAVAIALFFNNIIGQTLGLGVIGALSDNLGARFGDSALAAAVFGVCLAAGIAAMAIFAWTAAQMGPSGYLDKMRGG